MDVFDDFAIAYLDKIFTVIFYKQNKADLINDEYHKKAFEQEGDVGIAGYAYFDQTGKGSWDLIILQ